MAKKASFRIIIQRKLGLKFNTCKARHNKKLIVCVCTCHSGFVRGNDTVNDKTRATGLLMSNVKQVVLVAFSTSCAGGQR